MGFVEAERAESARLIGNAWTSATLGHLTTIPVILTAFITTLTNGAPIYTSLIWGALTTLVCITLIMAARTARTWRRIARIFEQDTE